MFWRFIIVMFIVSIFIPPISMILLFSLSFLFVSHHSFLHPISHVVSIAIFASIELHLDQSKISQFHCFLCPSYLSPIILFTIPLAMLSQLPSLPQ
jgi:hypothetical protein